MQDARDSSRPYIPMRRAVTSILRIRRAHFEYWGSYKSAYSLQIPKGPYLIHSNEEPIMGELHICHF